MPRTIGFLAKSLCSTQPLEKGHKLCCALDKRLTANLIYLDLSKAFDKVWHSALLYKLHCIGIWGGLYRWLLDYLTGRTQCVSLSGILSDLLFIMAGMRKAPF